MAYDEEEKKKKPTANSVAKASGIGSGLARNVGAATVTGNPLQRTGGIPSPMPSAVPSPAPVMANMSGGMKDPSDPFGTKSMGGGLAPSILGGYFGQKAAGVNTPQSDAAAGGLVGIARQPAVATTPRQPVTMPANTGMPSRAGMINQPAPQPTYEELRKRADGAIADYRANDKPVQSADDLDYEIRRKRADAAIADYRANDKPTQPVQPSTFVAPASPFEPVDYEAVAKRRAAAQAQAPVEPTSPAIERVKAALAGGVNKDSMAAAKNSLERSPANQAAIDLGRQAQAGVDINVGTGSAFENAKVKDMANRAGVVGNLQSGRDTSVAGAMRGGATEEQALAMGAQRGTPQVTQGMRDEAALLTGGKNITPRAQAQGMFAEPMDAEVAKAKMIEADGKNGPVKTAEETRAAKAAGAERWAAAQAKDKERRENDPLTLMNIARAQERPAQLAEKREVREQKGAANRLMRSAMGQRDPQVKAQMAGQAAEMAKAIGERPAVKRTTYGDIVDKQQATKTAETQLAAQRQHELDVANAKGVRTPSDKDVAATEKTRVETERLRGQMSPIDKDEYDALAEKDKVGLSSPEERARMAEILSSTRQRVGGAGGGAGTLGTMGGKPVTESDISATMKARGMTREQVMAELAKRGFTANGT